MPFRNALVPKMYEDDDPSEIPPEGATDEMGPPDQYQPQDLMDNRNALAPRMQRVGFGGDARGQRALRSNNTFEIEQYLRELAQSPQGATDAGIADIRMMARQYGVRTPYDRAFNDPPTSQNPMMGPSGKPRPLMRDPDSWDIGSDGRDRFGQDRYQYEHGYDNLYMNPPQRR